MMAWIDIEANSLSSDSHPLEVAWVFDDGKSESWIIAPQAGWTDWDDASAAAHGITQAMLAANGKHAPEVARRLYAALDGFEIFSDAPMKDRIWLAKLLETADLPLLPVHHHYDAYGPFFSC